MLEYVDNAYLLSYSCMEILYGVAGLYLKRRHRKWWAIHDIPPKLRVAMGTGRLAVSLETDDEKTAKKRADLLWLHDWSRRIEEARRGSPQQIEYDAVFLRGLMQRAETEEERGLIRERIADEADDRVVRALHKAGYHDEREIPHDEDVPGMPEAKRFFDLATGQVAPFLEHVDEWLATLSNEAKTKDMKRSTVALFNQTFPYVQDVNRKDVQRWFNKRASDEALTTKTLKRVLSELRSYWVYLRSLELVAEDTSPFDKLTLSGKKSDDRRPFEADQVVTLLRAAQANGDAVLADVITLGMWTGARIESLCKLRVSDVRADHFRIEDDKTASGNRDVPIHTKLKPTLKRLIADSESGFVLSGVTANKYGDRSDAVGKRFGRLKKELGFGEAHVFHSIRKTVTTILENSGVSENIAADIVGHDKPRMTYGLYSGGASLKTKREALEKLSYPGL